MAKKKAQRRAASKVASPPGSIPTYHEQWATCRLPDRMSQGKYQICLWGAREDAEENRDPDERVCRVRVEVLEMV